VRRLIQSIEIPGGFWRGDPPGVFPSITIGIQPQQYLFQLVNKIQDQAKVQLNAVPTPEDFSGQPGGPA
jgi:hypothetical protein